MFKLKSLFNNANKNNNTDLKANKAINIKETNEILNINGTNKIINNEKTSEYWCMGCNTPLEFEGDQLCPACKRKLSEPNNMNAPAIDYVDKIVINFENCVSVSVQGDYIGYLIFNSMNIPEDNDPDNEIDLGILLHKKANTYVEQLECNLFDKIKHNDITSIDIYSKQKSKSVYIPYEPYDNNLGSPNIKQWSAEDMFGNLIICFDSKRIKHN